MRIKLQMKNMLGVFVGAILSATALKLFVRPANLIPAGVSGLVSLIQKEMFLLYKINLPFGILYLLINLLIVAVVYKKMGKNFLLYSLMHVVLTSIFVELIPYKTITNDVILLTTFGGVINGLGITLALKMGGSSGGTDFVAVYYSIVKNRPMWDKIMIFNALLLLYNGWRFNWTLSFYSIIYQFASTEILTNYHDRYKLSSLRIITNEPREVADEILKVVRHGITQFEGYGLYKNKKRYMLYTVVNSFEIKSVIQAIKTVDSKAFIEVSTVDRIEGNFRQKPLN